MERGKAILIEGTDSSGKETQTDLLVQRLKSLNIPVESMSFPRYPTPSGRIIGECYLGRNGGTSWFEDPATLDPKVASLYYAADRRLALPEINKILESGTHIIFDRYVEANKGHQAGKESDPTKRAQIIQFIDCLEHELLELPRTDLTIFMYMPYQVGMELKRRNQTARDGHEKNTHHLRNSEKTYLELAKQYGWTQINCAPDKTIGSLRTPKDIAEEVFQHVKKIIY